ncbi:hypothetical protein FRB94_005453 [Tulasnella sp. JGI-2019a]|nr:hypothetical protein FRB94_005453 [Tulasnella sp. JGI-2019a]
MSRSRYFENNLKPLEIHHDSLKATLLTLRSAIATALRIIVTQHDSPDVDAREGPYIGESGIALMYIRLAIQAKATGLSQDIVDRLPAYARSHLSIDQKYGRPKPGHLAPLDSWVGHAVLEVIYELHYPSPTHHTSIWTAAADGVRSAILTALEDEGLGGDEVLYGRAGLLWAMLVLHTCVAQGLGAPDRRRELAIIINETQIGQVVGMIIQTGIHGAKAFKSEYHEEYRTLFGKHKSQDEIPLMWPWHGKFCLGA